MQKGVATIGHCSAWRYVEGSASSVSSDGQIRKELKNKISSRTSSLIVDELGVNHGAARVDLAVLGTEFHAYEIKSDADTLVRLPGQVKEYSKVFSHVTVVVGKRHIAHAIEIVPDWWGVDVAYHDSNGLIINTIRPAEENPELKGVAIARLLWKSEALQALNKIGKDKGVKSKSRSVVYERLAESLGMGELIECVVEFISQRTNWRSDLELQKSDDSYLLIST